MKKQNEKKKRLINNSILLIKKYCHIKIYFTMILKCKKKV